MEKYPSAQHRDSIADQFTRHYLIASIIPIILLLILIVASAMATRSYLSDLITRTAYDLNADAENGLQQLGEQIIQAKSRHVARELDIYFRTHPNTDIRKMRKDPLFMKLALQQVGKTGYTVITEARKPGVKPTSGMRFEPVIFRVHKTSAFNDRDMSDLGKTMPEWWAICKRGLDGVETSGYYNWREPDGSFRKKYLYVTPVETPLNGITMMASATTYIDEFLQPVAQMREEADTLVGNYKQYISRQFFTFTALAGLIVLLTFLGIFFWGRRTGLRYIMPITKLAESAKNVGEGKWDIEIPAPALARRDEIGSLARSFDQMSQKIQETFSSLEKRVAELRQAKDALKISEEHYRSLFDDVAIGLYRSTPDGRFLDVNPMMVRMMGYPDRETFMHSRSEDYYVTPRDRSLWQALMQRSADVQPFEVQIKKYDGTIIWVEDYSRAVKNESGDLLYYEGSLKDITERVLADRALKKSEAKFKTLYEESRRAQEVYRSLISSSADAIVIYNLDGQVTYVSPMFTTIFGWTLEELIDKPLPFVPESEKTATWTAVLNVNETGTPCQGLETQRLTKDGRVVDVSLSASRYNDHEGRPAGMLVILRDISESKQIKEHLQQVERLEAVATLAGGVAHDFNNLLTVIQGTVSVLIDASPEPDLLHKHLTNIEKQVNRGARLTRQLLGYARRGKYDIQVLSLNSLIRESADTLHHARKDLRIHYRLEANLRAVEADPYQMEQVLMNLLINASDAMSSGGDLTISTKNIDARDIPDPLREDKSGEFILLTVEDTGIGMDKKTMERIFEPFFTTKAVHKGTGLGLASAYGIIKNHNGVISVASEPGKGTAFSIYLPSTNKKPSTHVVKSPKIFAGEGRILIIDDEKAVLDIASQMLERLGYQTIKANGGFAGLALFEREKDRIDLVILDMIMPDISGSDVFDRLRTVKPDIKVLLSSGYSLDGKATEILNRGCNGFIQKPFNLHQFWEKVSGIMKHSTPKETVSEQRFA